MAKKFQSNYEKKKKKKGKLNTSHRYNLLLLLPSGPGRVQRELVVYDLPGTKVGIFSDITNLRDKFPRRDLGPPAGAGHLLDQLSFRTEATAPVSVNIPPKG